MFDKISKEDLENLFEGQEVELKKSLASRREAMEALCAMLNTEVGYGCIIFGIAPDKTVCGVDLGNLDTAQRSMVQHIRSKFDPPPISLDMQIQSCDGKSLLFLRAKRERTIPFHEYDGRAWIREGSCKRQLTLQEKTELSKIRDRYQHNGPWKCDNCGKECWSLLQLDVSDKGMKKHYKCDCGGEFWPNV